MTTQDPGRTGAGASPAPAPPPWRGRLTAAIDALIAEAERGGPRAAEAARRAGQLAEGRDAGRARAAFELAVRLDPLDAGPRLALCRLYAETGELDAARAEAAGAFTDAVDDADRARAAFHLGDIARARGDAAEARDAFLAVLKLEDKLLAADRADAEAARWRARAIGRLADLHAAAGEADEARAQGEAALAVLAALAAPAEESPVLAADRAEAELRLAKLDLDAQNPDAARPRLVQAIGRYEALAVTEPAEPHWRACLAQCWTHVAEAALAQRQREAARDAVDKALALRVKLAVEDKSERWALAGLWRVRAAVLAALGQRDEAVECLAQARALGDALCAEAPRERAAAQFLIHTLLEQSDAALAASRIAVSVSAAQAACALAARWCGEEGEAVRWRADLAAAHDRLGAAQSAAGARRAALEAATEAVKIRLELAEAAPGQAPPARALAGALERLGLAAKAQGDAAGASAAWRQAWRLIDRLYRDADDEESQRVRAVFETHLAGLGEADSDKHRASALARLDALDRAGRALPADAALRARLMELRR